MLSTDLKTIPHSALANRHILLGICGSIAAYKAAELIRLLQTQGAAVQVVMTANAERFITALTLQALSGHAVRQALFDTQAEAAMGHIELARWADVVLIAPTSANAIQKFARGAADDLLSTICLATRAPVLIAPAMNPVMWEKMRTHISVLQQKGWRCISPEPGWHACGDTGVGRLAALPTIVQALANCFTNGKLAAKRVLVTAGPTREFIDAARFLSNRSSGKMGYAIAQAAIDGGARVTLISGPTMLTPPERAICVMVSSAAEMNAAVQARAADNDMLIACAAVSDYCLAQPERTKRAKSPTLKLHLVATPDVLKNFARHKGDHQRAIGFAAESHDFSHRAQQKLMDKNLDLICVNDISRTDQGFDSDDNALTLFFRDGSQRILELCSKRQLAYQLVDAIALLYK